MIWESRYWKDPLLDSAKYLRNVRISERTTERTFVRIEKEILIGFYSVRKLLDTYKVSDASKKLKYDIVWFKNVKPVNYLNWHDIDKVYDLNKGYTESRNIRFICDKFIHSYAFVPFYEDKKLEGFYITTDNLKNEKCYFISIENIISIYRTIGRDYPSNFRQDVNPETGEFKVSAW